MLNGLLKNTASGKKNKKTFKVVSKFIKPGDVVWFSQGNHTDDTKILVLSKSYILLENVRYKVNFKRGGIISNHGTGVPWEIKAPTLKKVKEGKDYYIRCDFPENMEILNRRDNFRVLIPASKPYRARITFEDRKIIARIIDISVTGAQLGLSVQEGKLLAENGRIEHALLDIEGIFSDSLGLTVHWNKTGDDTSIVGVSFDEIQETEKSALSRLIFQLERERAQQGTL